MLFRKTPIIIFLFIFFNSYAQTSEDSTFYSASHKLENTVDDTGNQYIDVLSYKIDKLQLIPSEKLFRAKIYITIVSPKNLNSFYLDFHNTYKIISLKVNDSIANWRFEHGHNLYIEPKRPIEKNKKFIVEVNYYNTEIISELWDYTVSEGNFIFSDLPNYLLYPCNDIISERAYYSINTNIPKGYRIVSYGVPKRGKKHHNFDITSEKRITPNEFSLSLVKDYSSFSIGGSKRNYGSVTSRVNIIQYTPIGSDIVFRDLIKKVPSQMHFLDSILGNYPYKSFSVLITRNKAKKRVTLNRKYISIPYNFSLDTTEVESLILNGLAHQWFGNKISVKNSDDLWITKGASKYIEWLWQEKLLGKKKFNKMMSSKLVEAKKYMGLIDWHNMNPHPIYSFDLKNAVYDFGKLSENKILKKEELEFLYKVISLDTATVSIKIKESFEQRFGHKLSFLCDEGHSYYELMKWAKEQDYGSFKISADGFYTLKSMQNQEFKTHKFKLAKPEGQEVDADRGALFLHFLRLYYGDEVFFPKLKSFVSRYSAESISTQDIIDLINKETNGELSEVINVWLYSDSELPSFRIQSKNKE